MIVRRHLLRLIGFAPFAAPVALATASVQSEVISGCDVTREEIAARVTGVRDALLAPKPIDLARLIDAIRLQRSLSPTRWLAGQA